MQFDKVLLALIFVFMVTCCQSALTARLHHNGRSAAARIFPLQQRKLVNHGRSSGPVSVFDMAAPTIPASGGEEGRGLMKRFMQFKSLFNQEKTEPSNNIIIITQPAAPTDTTITDTQPTTTDTTGTITTLPTTATNTGRDYSKTELVELNVDLAIKTRQLNNGTNKELENSQAQEIVQEPLKRTKPKRKILKKFTMFNAKNLQNENQKPQNRRIRLSKRKQLRKRLPSQQTQTQAQLQHQQDTNTINVENLLNNMNLTKRPNQHAKHNSNSSKNHNGEKGNNNNNYNKNNNSSNKNHNNNASGTLNLNTYMRLQNIMNAFRKQTPIMYNY